LRRRFFEDDVDAAGRVVEVKQERSTEKTNHAEVKGSESDVVILERAEPRSLQEAISRGLVYESNYGPEALHRDISTEETEVFADLLFQLLDYDAEKRLSANDVLKHRWFKMGAQ
jgi:serine/threonine protein kinase